MSKVQQGPKPILVLIAGQDNRAVEPSGGAAFNDVSITETWGFDVFRSGTEAVKDTTSETSKLASSVGMSFSPGAQGGTGGSFSISSEVCMGGAHEVSKQTTSSETLRVSRQTVKTFRFPHGQNVCVYQWAVEVNGQRIYIPGLPTIALKTFAEKNALEAAAPPIIIKGVDGPPRILKKRIFCSTRNGGKRYLEAFPNHDVVRPRPFSGDQDQVWTLQPCEGGFKIACDTANGGWRCLEAFPKHDVVRPKPISDDQDQTWMLEQWGGPCIGDPGSYFRISCMTRNGGKRSLEAFPNHDVVRPCIPSDDQDQMWGLADA